MDNTNHTKSENKIKIMKKRVKIFENDREIHIQVMMMMMMIIIIIS